MFDLKKTKIYQAIKWEDFFKLINWLKYVFLLGLVASLILLFVSQLSLATSSIDFSLRFLALFLLAGILNAFFQLSLKKPVLTLTLEEALTKPEEVNLAEFLSFEPAKAVFKSLELSNLETNSSILFYFLLNCAPKLKFVFNRALLDFEAIKKELKKGFDLPFEKNLEQIISDSLKIAREKNHQAVSAGDFLITLCKIDPVFKETMISFNLFDEDIENLVRLQETLEGALEEKKKFWTQENLAKIGSIGRDWAAGYTITLDQYSVDWSDVIKKRGYEEIIGHKEEIKTLEMILARETSNNALLVGDPGTGRRSIVYALARKALAGQSLSSINYKRIVELDVSNLLARTEGAGGAESKLEIVFQEAVSAGNIILIIDRFPEFVSGKRKPGAIDISGILSKYIKFPQLQVVGICDFVGFHKYVEQNSSILSLFEKVTVSEISEKETILILQNKIPLFEAKYKKFISYPAIRDIVRYSEKYLPAVPFPKKAIDLLDEVMVYVSRYVTRAVVLPEHVAKIVSEKTKIPVGEMELKEKEVLLNLESLIHKRIINQEEAVKEVSEAIRRARAEITIRKGPIGAFLFLGPTGVGKTETSKALAAIYFGSEDQMIRLDMSEFQDIKDIPRLIGAPEQEGLLTTKVTEKPFSLILLDEIEKAHTNILNLFLQVLDEGHITDGVGRKISFKNTIIIATSNAGYKVILQALKEQTEWSTVKQKLLDELFENAIFRPEFINRFDAVVVFRPLTKENLLDIAHLMLEALKENLAQKHIEFEITSPLKGKVVELGYNPIFGAREMRRIIQDKVENVLARALLSGEIKRGDRIQITENFEIVKQ